MSSGLFKKNVIYQIYIQENTIKPNRETYEKLRWKLILKYLKSNDSKCTR